MQARTSAGHSIRWSIFLGFLLAAVADAGVAHARQDTDADGGVRDTSQDEPDEPGEPDESASPSPQTEGRARDAWGVPKAVSDPEALLPEIRDRNAEKQSVFPVSPLVELHELSDGAKADLYEATRLRLGLSLAHLFQWLSDAVPGEDTWGTTSLLDLAGTWELLDQGKPTQGQLFFHVQGRWDYGTTGPQTLGTNSLGSLIQTANPWDPYTPAFLLRNLYWQQGGEKAGWAYRVGKITPDATLSTSAHLSGLATFLSTASVGSFANALPDSGLGVVAAWYPNDRMRLLGLVSDANADRTNFGAPGKGDFYKAIELGVKLWPRTEKAGYSKFTLWHTDGTDDGEAANGNLGPDGWGFFLKHEQELTDDGKAIAIARYGWSDNGSALYEQYAGAHLLLYEPIGPARLGNDVVGVGFNWADAAPGSRSEYSLEAFYRFPVFPRVDMTFAYQSIWDPALDIGIDHAHVLSLRIRTTF